MKKRHFLDRFLDFLRFPDGEVLSLHLLQEPSYVS